MKNEDSVVVEDLGLQNNVELLSVQELVGDDGEAVVGGGRLMRDSLKNSEEGSSPSKRGLSIPPDTYGSLRTSTFTSCRCTGPCSWEWSTRPDRG